MKKKKLLAALVAAAVLSVGGGALAGCENQHTHTYSTDWEKDATGHWHVATCDDLKKGDEGYTKDFEAHVWGDDDECDVCHYKKTPDTPNPPAVTEYTVKLDANGGTLIGGKETVDVKTKDGKIESLPTPTAPEGMEFVGWFTEDVAGTEVTTQTAFKANATVYAHYVSVCTVTLNAGAGTLETKTLKAKDGKIESLPTPTAPAGKQFIGWFTAAEGGKEVTVATPFDEDTTIYAQYASVYTITLNVGTDGTLPAGASATLTTKGGKLETLPTPTTANATVFVGWFTAAEGGAQVTVDTVFTGDTSEITLYARYRQELTVTLNVGEGTLPAGASATMITSENKLSELPAPNAPANKWFKGWYTDATAGVKVSATTNLATHATANALTLYARYVEEVTVTLDKGDEGTLPAGAVTTYKTVGGKIVLPEGQRGLPAVTTDKEHWVFFGWFDKTSPLGTPVNIETAVFEKDVTLTAKVGRENGVWVGETFINTLTLNPGASRTEYWLGGGKITLKKGDVMSLYINGDLIRHYVEGNSAGINKPGEATQVTSVTVSVAGEFAIYLHKNSQDWSCEYSGPTEINVGSEVPYGCDSVTITIGSNAPITFFVKDSSGNGVGKADFSKFCIYTYEAEIFGNWAGSTTKGRLKEEITVSAAAVPSGWIFRWGSGYGSQTANIVGAFKAGKTYLVELPKSNKGTAKITELTITSVYTITLDQNYEGQPETKLTAKAYNGKLSYMPTFTREGYEDKDLFWYTAAEGGEKVTLNTVFTADATIYARWSEKIVATVDQNYTDKPDNTTVSLDHGKFTALPASPTRDDYDFVGWFTAATEGEQVTLDTEFTQNATIYAQWKAKIVITLDLNYTNKPDNTTVKANNGKLSPLPTAPTREGYEFLGWFTAAEEGTRITTATVFTENSTIYAQWRVPFKVTLNYNYKDCPEAEVKTAKVVSGATYSRLPSADIITPEREGYEFLGWYSNEDGTGTRLAASTSITEDTTYYASWKVPFKVTLILNYDGAPAAVVRTAKTVVGQTYSRLSAEDLVVEREGYDVTGWYPNADGTGTKLTTSTNISADVTYYAQWKEAYKVTLDLNYEGAPAALEKWAKLVINQTFSRVPAEDIVTPEREGYNFLGWYANANGSGETLTANTTITSSRTYYARWQKKYEVTFNLNYEGCGDPIVMLTEKVSGVTYGKISNPPTPTREGYEFVGWFDTAEETGGTALNANRITADGTYYARWTPVTEPTPTPEEQA